MTTAARHPLPIDGLPPVRGRIAAGAPIADRLWFRVGGPAEILYEPADEEDLAVFLRDRPNGVPITVLGAGSNVLVRDGGIAGIVVRLGRGFARLECGGAEVRVGAGAMSATLARACRDAGIAGFEFLSGVPGTVGGALRMNAGAYGGETADIVVGAVAFDLDGRRRRLDRRDLGYSYRACAAPPEWIFVSALMRGARDAPAIIAARMAAIAAERRTSQPVHVRTGGSTFKNPAGTTAWALIEEAGCRGLRRGGAEVSRRHANFLVNTGGARGADLEALGEEVRRRVRKRSGVLLEWEIRRLGEPAGEGRHG